MEIDLGRPNAKQDLFLMDHHRHVGYGGARAGGKSWAVRTKAILLALNYTGIVIMIVRRTYPELEANHIRPIRRMLHIGEPGNPIKYNESKKIITFPANKEGKQSLIIFGYCDREADVERYQGTEVDVLFIDEATMLTEQQIKDLNACVRSTNPDFPLRTYYTCNPGGRGHSYIKRVFIDRQYNADENPDAYSFIQAKVYDNKDLLQAHPEYLAELKALPEARRKAWLEGDWNSFIGQVFTSWRNNPDGYLSRRWTHVIEDFPIDRSWKVYRGFDFGYAKPFSVGWYAVDHYGRMYRFREYYGCTRQPDTGVQMEPREIARNIREIEKNDPNLKGRTIYGIADPAIWQSTTGESIADMMEKEGVYFSRGDHTRLAGLMQCQYRLAFDDEGFPMFYCFRSCKDFIRTVPALIYDDKKVEDVDTTMEDHIFDEWKYVSMENPINPRKSAIWTPPEEDPLDMYKR